MPRTDPSGTASGTTSLAQATASGSEITEERIYAAIADVLDPELDEPLVKLGFIDQVEIAGPDVTVTFRLPTYFCSPNFAYLMAKDLRQRVREVPGVRHAHVALLDHCSDEEVTKGVNGELSFAEAFPGETLEDEQLDDLRRTFLRKGFLMRQDTLLRQMMKAGLDEPAIAALRIADVRVDEAANAVYVSIDGRAVCLDGAGHNATTYLIRRMAIALPHAPGDAFIIDDAGHPLQAGSLKEFLRRSRSIRMNIVFNTALCKGLFQARYGRDNQDSRDSIPEEEGERL